MAPTVVDATSRPENWTTAAEQYQDNVGRMTAYGVTRLVQIVNGVHPFDNQSQVLDIGTGSGAVLQKIYAVAPQVPHLIAGDISPAMLQQVDALRLPNVSTQLLDATNLSDFKSDSFTHVFSTFTIQFVTDGRAAVREIYRVTKPGHVAAIAIWGAELDGEDLYQQACRSLKPEFEPPSVTAPGGWRDSRTQRKVMLDAGFKHVRTEHKTMPFEFDSAESYVEFWFAGKNPVAAKLNATAVAQGIDLDHLRSAMIDVLKSDYDDGKTVDFNAVLCIGIK